MRNQLIIGMYGCLVLLGCKFNPNYQGVGSSCVQGEWEEIPPAYQPELLQYTQHQFKFSCDSFYVNLTTHAKTNIYTDSCFNQGVWKEYAKGTYETRGDTLYLSGTFTKANGKQKISGCYRIGQYVHTLIIQKNTQNTLLLKSLSQQIPLSLRLNKAVVCKPKPLN